MDRAIDVEAVAVGAIAALSGLTGIVLAAQAMGADFAYIGSPWIATVEAINTKVKRGELRLGVHYFQEHGRARRTFKWSAIVDYIEGRTTPADATASETPNVAKATAELQRLLPRRG